MNEADEERGAVRRKKVCPSCRTQVVTPPLELWALKGVLDALRERSGTQQDVRFIQQGLWEGLFDPATFYHVIRDEDDDVLRCGVCSSEILDGQCTNPDWYVSLLTQWYSVRRLDRRRRSMGARGSGEY